IGGAVSGSEEKAATGHGINSRWRLRTGEANGNLQLLPDFAGRVMGAGAGGTYWEERNAATRPQHTSSKGPSSAITINSHTHVGNPLCAFRKLTSGKSVEDG